jgi:hypothetical protein
MDSAYMSDAMCLVGRYVWLFNFVGTVISSRTGAGTLGKEACLANEIVIGGHESLLFQHNTHPLMYAVWGDNNFVRTLSNFHSPIVVPNGIMRKCRDPITKVRAREATEVNISEQQLAYCDTYYVIDKGNGIEAKYDLACESHLHGWSPKLSLRYINMTSNNSYNFFCALYNKYHPGRDPMELKDCINNVTHSLLQEGEDIRQRSYGAPPSVTKDLTSSTSTDGRAIRSDSKNQPFTSPTPAHGTGATHAGTPTTPGSALTPMGLYHQEVAFKKRRRDYISRVHQPMPCLVRGTGEKSGSGNHCRYKKCPGLNNKKKTKRSYTTIYQFEQCTVEKKRPMWLCHTTKKINGKDTVVSCHLKYHAQKEFLKTTSSSECSLVSDLTETETDPPNNDISSV